MCVSKMLVSPPVREVGAQRKTVSIETTSLLFMGTKLMTNKYSPISDVLCPALSSACPHTSESPLVEMPISFDFPLPIGFHQILAKLSAL